ncbi:hypothetical protein M949_0461 [Riemerella anatipestifer CH3]|nr:hypothetical protein M949_0461 [Riemerella anatipestifer CH3]
MKPKLSINTNLNNLPFRFCEITKNLKTEGKLWLKNYKTPTQGTFSLAFANTMLAEVLLLFIFKF